MEYTLYREPRSAADHKQIRQPQIQSRERQDARDDVYLPERHSVHISGSGDRLVNIGLPEIEMYEDVSTQNAYHTMRHLASRTTWS